MYSAFFLQVITAAGGVSADYTLVILVGVVGFLIVTICGIVGTYFVNALRDMKTDIKVVYGRVYEVESRQRDLDLDTALLKQSVVTLNDNIDPQHIAEIIYAKIKAAQG